MAGLKAGSAYFASMLAVGFLFGTVRVMLGEPLIGKMLAVLAELPVMIAISYWVAGRLVDHFRLPRGAPRVIMGGSAFLLLQMAVVALSSLFGVPPYAYLLAILTPEGLLGMAGQILFAILPLIAR